MKQEIPWSKHSVEALVIVGSILLAFAIDAWWDSILKDRQETEALIGLVEEFETNLLALDIAVGATLAKQQEAVDVLTLTDSRISEENNVEALRSLAKLITTTDSFQPAEGTLSYLISNQGIGIISNEDLRLYLMGWPKIMTQVENRQQRIREIVRQYFMPYLWTKVPVKVLDAIAATASIEQLDLSGIHAEEFFSELQFQNIVNEIRYAYSIQQNWTENARAEAELILQLARDEIQGL